MDAIELWAMFINILRNISEVWFGRMSGNCHIKEGFVQLTFLQHKMQFMSFSAFTKFKSFRLDKRKKTQK